MTVRHGYCLTTLGQSDYALFRRNYRNGWPGISFELGKG